MTELNTLLGLPVGFDPTTLQVGKTFTVVKERERSFPLHIAMLMVDGNWNFYGYGTAHSIVVKNGKTEITFEVLSLFTENEKKLYSSKFVEAAKKTGEIK